MSRKSFLRSAGSLLVLCFLILCATAPAVFAQAQDIEVDFPEFLSASLGIDSPLGYSDIFDALTTHYEELIGVALPPPARYFQYPNRATVSHDTYALHVYPFRLPAGPPHLFLHLRLWREDIPIPGRFAILAWNEEQKRLVPVRVFQDIPFDEFVEVETIQLDEFTHGIAVGGFSGPTGERGNFTVLAYDPEDGFETVWIIDAPGHQVTIIHEAMPVALSHLERSSWDDSFPVTDLGALNAAQRDAYVRQYTATYLWDRDRRTFLLTGRTEVMHDFAVVNHFLKALFAGDRSFLEYVAGSPELYNLLAFPLPEEQPPILRLARENTRLVPLSPHTAGIARLLGIDVENGRWITIAALPEELFAEAGGDLPGAGGDLSEVSGNPPEASGGLPEASGNPPEASGGLPEASTALTAASGGWSGANIDWSEAVTRAEAFAFFEVRPGEPAQIARMHYYEPQPLPEELSGDLEYDPRPTFRFDKLAIRAWAIEHGWDEANARVKRVKSVDGVGDWLRVSAVMSTPVVRWVELHYRTDLNLEPPSRAEELYETTVGLDVTPFLLQLTSPSLAALQPENIRVVLSDDRGNRWQGTITGGPYDAFSYFGVAIYERLFWLEFSGPQTEQEWAEIKSVTLHVIRQDRLARADLTWRFEP